MRIHCFGELLVDFLAQDSGVDLAQAESFIRAPGGAPANVAADLAALGLPAAFVGQVGDDAFGRYLALGLASAGVNDSLLTRSPQLATPLAFIAALPDGRRQVEFAGLRQWAAAIADDPSTDALFKSEPGWLHVGGVASAWTALHARQRQLLARARQIGWRTSLDVNYRPALFAQPLDFSARMADLFPLCDVVKLSDEELNATFGPHVATPAAATDKLLAIGVQVVAVTAGARGATVADHAQKLVLPALQTDVVEPTGAGDAFMAGLIAALSRNQSLNAAAALANRCGAAAVAQVGARLRHGAVRKV